jgi:hypothetical protein
MPAYHGEIFEGFGIHDPAIVSNLAPLVILKLAEVSFNYGIVWRNLVFAALDLEVPYLAFQVTESFLRVLLDSSLPHIVVLLEEGSCFLDSFCFIPPICKIEERCYLS